MPTAHCPPQGIAYSPSEPGLLRWLKKPAMASIAQLHGIGRP
jgi:hypothetical protein